MQDVPQLINPLSRGLPKTLVETSYRAGDDGEYEAGWWKGRLNANNRQQYLTKTIDGDDVVIDLATGLTWAKDGELAGCNNGLSATWTAAIDYALGLTFAGHSDWRIPNAKELVSIVKYSRVNPTIHLSYFTNTAFTYYWSSSTYSNATSMAWIVNFSVGNCSTYAKITPSRLRCVRGGL